MLKALNYVHTGCFNSTQTRGKDLKRLFLYTVLAQKKQIVQYEVNDGFRSGTLCAHNCSLKVQHRSLTRNEFHSLDLNTLKSSLLYIKRVSKIHLDSYTFFNFCS